ncbi:MAG: hypothetical protein DYH03_13215 [Nitrospira sp. NTP1]|nr:hypothetical protein [Nitrospira sp. NTP1]
MAQHLRLETHTADLLQAVFDIKFRARMSAQRNPENAGNLICQTISGRSGSARIADLTNLFAVLRFP